jgi:hypothetical protein
MGALGVTKTKTNLFVSAQNQNKFIQTDCMACRDYMYVSNNSSKYLI